MEEDVVGASRASRVGSPAPKSLLQAASEAERLGGNGVAPFVPPAAAGASLTTRS